MNNALYNQGYQLHMQMPRVCLRKGNNYLILNRRLDDNPATTIEIGTNTHRYGRPFENKAVVIQSRMNQSGQGERQLAIFVYLLLSLFLPVHKAFAAV